MKNKKNLLPTCDVIILNYNGSKIISKTIDAVLQINYPNDRFQVVVVDNNSSDNSQKIIKNYAEKHKNVSYIFSNKNLGFAGGNNLGIKKSQADYIVLLNNDCFVEKNWLMGLVETAKKNKKVFSVGSKILLYPKFINLKIDGCTGKSSRAFLSLVKSKLLVFNKKIELQPIYKSDRSLNFSLPIDVREKEEVTIKLTLEKKHFNPKLLRADIVNPINFKTKPIKPIKTTFKKSQVTLTYNLTKELIKDYSYDKIQNAGSFIFQDGYGRDIGAVVSYGHQDYELDVDQYNKEREVFSTCGASCLYNRKTLEKIGYLDESFFMYYEDTELSWRARNYGYKNYFSPSSVVRHLHGFSSKEWSDFFVFNVEKSRLVSLYFSIGGKIFLKEYIKFLTTAIYHLIRNYNFLRLKVSFSIITSFPQLAIKKRKLYKDKQTKLNQKNVYKEIMRGKWILNANNL